MATLPQDVFDCAIDNLKGHRRALGACALVCRDWLHRSHRHLFSEITFQYPIQNVPSPHPTTVSLGSSTFSRGPDRAMEFISLITRNPKLAEYVQAVTVSADKKIGGAEARRWTLLVAGHLHLLRLPQLRSLRLVRFEFETFADLIPTIQAIPTLDSLSCEDVQFLPPPFSPVQPVDTDPLSNSSGSGTLDQRPEQATLLKTLSLSVVKDLSAVVEWPDTDAAARALHSAQAFMRSGFLRTLTSLEIFDASTVLGWLPVIERLGPQLHHVGIALHDVSISDDEVLPGDFIVSPSPRNTVLRVFDVLRRCTALRTLCIKYEADDSITVCNALAISGERDYFGRLITVEDGPPISSYVRLFSGASLPSGRSTAPPFLALEVLELRLTTAVHSLQSCASACAALAIVLASPDHSAFRKFVVVIKEPQILGDLWGDEEVDEAACERKLAALRGGLFRPFEEAGIALEVAVLPRVEGS